MVGLFREFLASLNLTEGFFYAVRSAVMNAYFTRKNILLDCFHVGLVKLGWTRANLALRAVVITEALRGLIFYKFMGHFKVNF